MLFVFIIETIIIVSSENDNNNFPWNGDYESRSKEILELMKNDMTVAFKADHVPLVIQNGGIIKATNSSGDILEIGIQKEIVEEESSLELTSIDSYNILLDGYCTIMLNNWWNYEWCYRKEVRQFHLEHPTPSTSQQTQPNKPLIAKRNPDFSLGVYERTLLTRKDADSTNSSSPITRIVEYYKGGQKCDENGALRSTEVTIKCCPEKLAGNNKKKQLNHHQGSQSNSKINSNNLRPITSTDSYPQIQSIHEPALCEYRLTVCYDLLCSASNEDEIESQPSTLVEIVQQIAPMCMSRVEDWWTYELCFSKEVRQFHVETSVSVDKQGRGVEKRQIHQLFSLGHKPFSTDTNANTNPNTNAQSKSDSKNNLNNVDEETLFNLFVPASASSSGKPSLQLEYSDGTECDIEELKRSTTVELFCSTSGKDEIVNIVEDRTCHYHMQVGIVALCAASQFEPAITKSVILDFVSPDVEVANQDKAQFEIKNEINAATAVLSNQIKGQEEQEVENALEEDKVKKQRDGLIEKRKREKGERETERKA